MTNQSATSQVPTPVNLEKQSYQSYQSGTVLKNETLPQTMEETETSTEKESTLSCILRVLGMMRLEIVIFLCVFSYNLTEITSTTMILAKVCLSHFNYSKSVCDNLANYSDLKPQVEKVATNYQLGHTLIETAPSALLACFIGPWSDQYGRKFPLILAMSGRALNALGSAVCAYYLNSPVEYYLIPALFTGFTGGIISIRTIAYSYASDLTQDNKRTIKFAMIDITIGVTQSLASTAGGWIYKFLGFPYVFDISFLGLVISVFCVICLLPETRGLEGNATCGIKVKKFFSCKTLVESFKATTRERPNKGRKQTLLLIMSTSVLAIAMNSTGDINYLYVHHQFNWGNTEYSNITAIYTICTILALTMLIPLFRHIRITDAALGLIGTTSLLGKFIGIGLSFKEFVFHIAYVLGLLSGCASFAARSRISKIVSSDDIGKVFSFVATVESLIPILATVLFTQIFNAFLTIYPGMPYTFLAAFLILPFSVFIWISRLPKSSYGEMKDVTAEEQNTITKTET